MKARQRLEQARRTLAARPWAAAAAGVAAIAIVAGFLLLADWRASAARERANLWELHTLEVQLAAQKLLGAVQEAEANQRAFVFVGRDAYLEPYRDAAAEARAEVDALKRLTIDNPVQQQRLSVIDELMRSRLDALEDGVALVRQNRRAVAMARLRAGAAQGRSHQLRAQIEGLVQEEQRLLIQRRAAADRAQAQDERLAWMILALVAVLLAAMSWISQLGLRAARQAREQSERTAMAERVQALLQEKVDAATADLRRSEAQLRQAQKMEAIGQLAGGVAHDFNNMLAIIIGSLELAQRRLADNEDVQRLIAAAMDGARRAAALTQRILAFSRQQPLDPKVLDANRLVADMSELLRRTLGETVKFESVLAGGLWPVRADANQLENALVNLAVNARDAMENGGKLTIETGNAYLDDAYARTRAEVRPGQY
ncbi:MAG: CHASE3 domain-containing protein, partial [Hyphomonadaceae bacterium]